MSRFFFVALLLLSANFIKAQVGNDDCSTAIDLGTAPYCDLNVVFSNVNATPSDIPVADDKPSCYLSSNPIHDVWFTFVASDTIVDYALKIQGLTDGSNGPLTNPHVAIYRGDCTDELAELICFKVTNGDILLEANLLGLTAGATYFIRVFDYSDFGEPENWGVFNICIIKKPPSATIDQGFSNECAGSLYDSGGEDGDYGDNENYVYVICPNQVNKCITFTLDYYNLEGQKDFNTSDVLNFYDGNGINTNLITSISSGQFAPNTGGVNQTIVASSGCMTIEFISDASISFEGFAGSWKCTTGPCIPITPIAVDEDVVVDQIISTLGSDQAIITLDTLICAKGAYGIFNETDHSDLGIKRGIILTSGLASNAIGPNLQTFTTYGWGSEGDDDLDMLSSLFGDGSFSNDACVLELEIFATTDELRFEYTFGSEEYPEFVNNGFNDIFAFLISGPGIVGIPEIGNQDNIAIIPEDGTPIEINNVNFEKNWQYYRPNYDGKSIEYDGLTNDKIGSPKKSLTARSKVIPCNTYKLKLKIADRGDFSYDSGVFISSIRGANPTISINTGSNIGYFLEGCAIVGGEFIISIPEFLDKEVKYKVTISGTATLGIDYLLNMPDSITLSPGSPNLVFPVTPISDALVEGTETIIVSLSADFGCGDITLISYEAQLRETLFVEVNAGVDTIVACKGDSIQLTASGAKFYSWAPPVGISDPTIGNPKVAPQGDQTYVVTGTLDVCEDKDTIFIHIVEPSVEITTNDPTAFCGGDSITLTAVVNEPGGKLEWVPKNQFFDASNPVQTLFPFFDQIFTVTYSIGTCTVQDTLSVVVDFLSIPFFPITDTTICRGASFTLYNDFSFGQVVVTPTTYLDLSDPFNVISSPLADITYTIITTSQNAICADTTIIPVIVKQIDVSISNPDTVFLCLGDSVLLSATHSAGAFMWIPATGLADSSASTTFASPKVTTTYTAFVDNGECTFADKVVVKVDSLPNLPISRIPDKDKYCKGEIIALFSSSYSKSKYPKLKFIWENDASILKDLDNQNNAISAETAKYYFRTMTNGACSALDSVYVNVINPNLPLGFYDTIVCPYTPVTLIIQDTTIKNLGWSPPQFLDCSECLTPVATVGTTTLFTATAEVEGCPAQASVLVRTYPSYGTLIQVDTSGELAQGTTVTCTIITVPDISAGTEFTWYVNGVEQSGKGPVIQVVLTQPNNKIEVYFNTPQGCPAFHVIEIPTVPATYEIPNAFAPTGKNQYFRPVLKGLIQVLEFKVFNRWGQLVYDNQNTDGWNGTFKGSPAPAEVYIYLIRLHLPDGKVVVEKGDVTLLR
ncbi:MAG: choice-of-anchor L domain-containing protein [Saprospiraceae bacterium]